jgi:hypothetical protein
MPKTFKNQMVSGNPLPYYKSICIFNLLVSLNELCDTVQYKHR